MSQEEPEASPPEEAAPAQEEQQIELHDAARRWVPGFKEYWWPGIKHHAETLGFPGQGTEEQCKAVLRRWGAKI